MVTPESVRVRVQKEKELLKAQYYERNGQAVAMKDDLGTLIASTINRFFNAKEYNVWDQDFSGDTRLQSTILTSEEASAVIESYGSKFVKSTIIFQDYWFFITSYSCFIHQNPQIDDCADSSKYGFQSDFKAFIRRKTRMGKDSFELTYRIGHLEILATSGFFGTLDGSFFSAFLGSAIADLPSKFITSIDTISTGTVFIPRNKKGCVRSHRILNQYFKKHSTNNWGFYSQKFRDTGFSPADPLSFESKNLVGTSASFIIRSFAFKVIDKKRVDSLFLNLHPNKGKILTETGKTVERYLQALKQHKSTAFTRYPPEKTRKDLINIYNN